MDSKISKNKIHKVRSYAPAYLNIPSNQEGFRNPKWVAPPREGRMIEQKRGNTRQLLSTCDKMTLAANLRQSEALKKHRIASYWPSGQKTQEQRGSMTRQDEVLWEND